MSQKGRYIEHILLHKAFLDILCTLLSQPYTVLTGFIISQRLPSKYILIRLENKLKNKLNHLQCPSQTNLLLLRCNRSSLRASKVDRNKFKLKRGNHNVTYDMVRSVNRKRYSRLCFSQRKYTQVTQAGGGEALGEELYILAAILVAV